MKIRVVLQNLSQIFSFIVRFSSTIFLFLGLLILVLLSAVIAFLVSLDFLSSQKVVTVGPRCKFRFLKKIQYVFPEFLPALLLVWKTIHWCCLFMGPTKINIVCELVNEQILLNCHPDSAFLSLFFFCLGYSLSNFVLGLFLFDFLRKVLRVSACCCLQFVA